MLTKIKINEFAHIAIPKTAPKLKFKDVSIIYVFELYCNGQLKIDFINHLN